MFLLLPMVLLQARTRQLAGIQSVNMQLKSLTTSFMNTFKRLDRPGQILSLITLCCVLTALLPSVSLAQGNEPERDQLLNGLRILLWSRPGDQTVLLKLRIHSGAAFDTTDKAGTMALLGDILFPDTLTHDYFTQEMGGKLAVETDHDAITITLQGRASEYDRIVDSLRAALVTTPLTPENFAKVRELRLKGLSHAKFSGAELADRTIAERLLGNFPYAKPVGGTAESLARIERSDLMLAREKFLNPNNATLVISGGVDHRHAMRALKQLLGGWRKSEQLVPATFRRPEPPDSRVLIANSPDGKTAEVRVAMRGLELADHDYFASVLLTSIARNRWQKLLPDLKGTFAVTQEGHVLPGMFLLSASVEGSAAARTLEAARKTLKSLVDSPVLPGELDTAKREALALMNQKLSQNDMLAEAWLDLDTYSLPALADLTRTWGATSTADVQNAAVRLFRDTPTASVVVGKVDELKSQLAPSAKVEVLGEAKPKTPEPQITNVTPQPPRRKIPVFSPKTQNPLLKSSKPAPTPE
jgi:zinc protease